LDVVVFDPGYLYDGDDDYFGVGRVEFEGVFDSCDDLLGRFEEGGEGVGVIIACGVLQAGEDFDVWVLFLQEGEVDLRLLSDDQLAEGAAEQQGQEEQ